MAEPPFAPLRILAVLDAASVECIVIGGFAAVIHGSPLATNDADICPRRTPENLGRLARALSELDARIALPDDPRGVDFPHDAEFIGKVDVWNLVTRYGRLDISFVPSGTKGFDDLRRDAIEYELGGEVRVRVASLLDVIRSKEAAGRDKDRRALPLLRRLLEHVEEGP